MMWRCFGLICVAALQAAAFQEPPPTAPLELLRTLGDENWLGSPKPFDHVALSPDAGFAAGSSSDHRLQAWDLKKRCRVLEVGFDRETRVLGLLMPEEGTLVASHADGRLRVWTLDGKGAAATEHRLAGPGRLAASPVAGTLFCAGAGLRWVDWRSGETRAEFTLLRNSAPQSVSDVSALAVGSDGERLFSGHGGEILEWNPRKGSLVGAFPFELSAGRVTSLALNAAGTQLLSGHETGTVLEWTLASREHRVLLPPPKRRPTAVLACGASGTVHASGLLRRSGPQGVGETPLPLLGGGAAAFASRSGLLAVAEAPPRTPGVAEVPPTLAEPAVWSVLLWDAVAGRLYRPEGGAHDASVIDAAVVGQRIVTRSRDAILLWNAGTGDVLARVTEAPGAFSVSHSRLLTTSAAGVEILDLETGKVAARIVGAEPSPAALLLAGPERALLARGDSLDVWSVEQGRQERSIACGAAVWQLHPHADPGLVVAAHGRSFSVVDVAAGKVLARIPAGAARIIALGLSRDGRTAATCTLDYEVEVWETRTGKALARQVLKDPPLSLSFGTNALFIGFVNNRIARWEWTRAEPEIRQLKPRVDLFQAASDDSTVFIGSGGDVLRLDFGSGRLSAPSKGHQGTLTDIIIPESGDTLLSISSDRTARLWRKGKP